MKRRLRALFASLKKPALWLDAGALTGAGATLTGLWWIYPPLAAIAGGAALVSLCVWAARRWDY